MKNKILKYFLFISTLYSCGVTNKSYEKKEYKKAKLIATYSGIANEFQDGYLVLKENGYFKFYQKFWLIVTLKQSESIGRYSQKNDTLILNWLDKDPKQIKYYLSKKCIIDSTTKNLWFINELTNQRLWRLNLIQQK